GGLLKTSAAIPPDRFRNSHSDDGPGINPKPRRLEEEERSTDSLGGSALGASTASWLTGVAAV
ncbi:hypothetical protein, partial [Planobispora rosea]|uniref:hypothetical protein n=1 Tax=Planobispora rosea TaxID=35762 RepID=UPI001E64A4CA